MIDSCPSPWRYTTTAQACMSTDHSADPAVALPVSDRTTNFTYANIYCAMCHGKSRDLHHWSLRIQMMPMGPRPTLKDTRSTKTRWEVIPVGEIIPEKCILTPSEANTEPDTKIKRLCRSYSNAITVIDLIGSMNSLHIKNPHCALLSNPDLFVNKKVVCLSSHPIRFPPRLPSMLFVFSKLHPMAEKSSYTQNVRVVKFNCQDSEIYDPFQNKCLAVHSAGHSKSNNITVHSAGHSKSNNIKTTHTNTANTTNHICRGPRFSSPEFLVLCNNSVFIISHSKVYNNDSYILVNQTLILCANFSRNYTSRINDHKKAESFEKPPSDAFALRILTYIGFSLSIIALLFLLVTYFLFSELRTYHGKMVMHLSCAMIAMQSVYFASDPVVVSSAVCAVMGALLHYFILAMFLWMSVIAHNTQTNFSSLSK